MLYYLSYIKFLNSKFKFLWQLLVAQLLEWMVARANGQLKALIKCIFLLEKTLMSGMIPMVYMTNKQTVSNIGELPVWLANCRNIIFICYSNCIIFRNVRVNVWSIANLDFSRRNKKKEMITKVRTILHAIVGGHTKSFVSLKMGAVAFKYDGGEVSDKSVQDQGKLH